MKSFAKIVVLCALVAGLSACNKACKKKECTAEHTRMEQIKKEFNHK